MREEGKEEHYKANFFWWHHSWDEVGYIKIRRRVHFYYIIYQKKYDYVEEPVTMVSSGADVTITEGMSGQVSCMSTGIPVPSITWRIDNQTTSFFQIDTITDVSFEMRRSVTTGIQRGSIVSVLYIENAQYPTHHGIYECTAVNTDNLANFSSSATITVHIQGKRVVIASYLIV